MTAGRPELELGTHGHIHTIQTGGTWRARTRVRDYDGATRQLQRTGPSRAAAERALQAALRDRFGHATRGLITPDSKLADVAEKWLTEISDLSPSTQQLYRDRLRLQVLPALGKVRLRELTVGLVDRHLTTVAATSGPAMARLCRSVLSGICGLAVRHDALRSNPCRDVARITTKPAHPPTALSEDQVRAIHAALLDSPTARRQDLPDLVAFLAGTGARIGETCALTWNDVDLDTGHVHLHGTVLRIRGEGLVISRPKTPTSDRTIHAPSWCRQILQRRHSARSPGFASTVFPAPAGNTLRDPANTRRTLRVAFAAAGSAGLTSHAFRRTVATLMDTAGYTARNAADQLGHANPAITLTHYMGRQPSVTGAAQALDNLQLGQQPNTTTR